MTDIDVTKQAKHLLGYATHFEHRDWNYTRKTGLIDIVHERDDERFLRNRIKSSWRWLTRKTPLWSKEIGGPGKFQMAMHVLKRRPNLPDGSLDGGGVITFWEETGEYLQLVQPTVGEMLANWMLAEPENPHAIKIATELARINDGYTQRIANKEVE